MTTAHEEMQAIERDLAEVNSFVSERFNPMEERLDLAHAEMERLKTTVTHTQEGLKEIQRREVAKTAEKDNNRLVVPSGPYAGYTPLDVALMRGFARSQERESYGPAWGQRADEAQRLLREHAVAGGHEMARSVSGAIEDTMKQSHGRLYGEVARGMLGEFHRGVMGQTRAAMDSTTASSGDELVATLQARELWMDVNLQTLVAGLIPTAPMPSNPFQVPTQLGDVNFYPGTENIAVTSTAPTTARVTLTAYELVGQVPYSFTLEEDAIIAMMPEIRAGVVRNVAEILDDIILNADTTATNGINSDGATIASTTAGKGHWLLGYDGLIHLPLIDNTSQAVNHNAAVSDDMFNEIRSKLGKYGARPSELVWIMDVNTFIRAQAITNFRTMDKLGPQATLLSGMLGAVEGIPTVVSEQIKLADTDGKVTDSGNGTDTGRLLIINRNQWRQGFRRDLTVDVDRDTQKRQTVVTVSFRHALTERTGSRSSATHTAISYDITGVS